MNFDTRIETMYIDFINHTQQYNEYPHSKLAAIKRAHLRHLKIIKNKLNRSSELGAPQNVIYYKKHIKETNDYYIEIIRNEMKNKVLKSREASVIKHLSKCNNYVLTALNNY